MQNKKDYSRYKNIYVSDIRLECNPPLHRVFIGGEPWIDDRNYEGLVRVDDVAKVLYINGLRCRDKFIRGSFNKYLILHEVEELIGSLADKHLSIEEIIEQSILYCKQYCVINSRLLFRIGIFIGRRLNVMMTSIKRKNDYKAVYEGIASTMVSDS